MCGVRVCMYIYVYVINIYVYMYIRVCAKHARVHSFNANCTSWGGRGAGGAGFVPALLAPSFTPATGTRAGSCPLGSARAGGRSALPPAPFPGWSRNGARGGSEAPGRAARLRGSASPHVPVPAAPRPHPRSGSIGTSLSGARIVLGFGFL